MKKVYEMPEIEVVKFFVGDIITTSVDGFPNLGENETEFGGGL